MTSDVTVRSEDIQTTAPPPPPSGATESGPVQPTVAGNASTATPSTATPGTAAPSAPMESRTAANQSSGGH
jgi:hypothetical protein